MRIPELDRINELARIAKTRALSAEEIAERDRLRQGYIGAVTGQLKSHLAGVTVIDPEGRDVTPRRFARRSGNRHALIRQFQETQNTTEHTERTRHAYHQKYLQRPKHPLGRQRI